MRRKNNFKKVLKIRYLIIFIIITYAILSYFSSAKYTSNTKGTDSAIVAMYINEVSSLEIPIIEVKPGYSESFNFIVQNNKDGQVSQVAEEYTIEVKTTANLPLMYKLKKNNSAVIKESSKSFVTGVQELTAMTQSDSYTLEVSWPTDASVTAVSKNEDFMLDIDYITLKVKTVQKD